MTARKNARLKSFCMVGAGGTPSRDSLERYYQGGTIPWVKSGELREKIIFDTEEQITEEALRETNVKIVPAGALLLAMYGATVGRLGILGVPATTNQAVCHIIPDPMAADVRYLFHVLSNQVSALVARGVGGAQPNISQGIVKDLSVALPPLPEQRRLAAILDKADELRVKRRAAIAKIDILTQSIFLDMFGDPVTNPKGWPEGVNLGEVSEIVSGVTKGRQLSGKVTRTVPYLAVINVQDRALNLSVVKSIEATEEEIERYRLVKDDLLLTEGGDPDKLGRGTLWGNELSECIHQNHVFRVRLKSDMVEPFFLEWLIGSMRGKHYFLRSAKQTTGIATINMTQLRSFPLLLPPVKLQREFAARLAALEAVTRKHRASLSKLNDLFSTVQHRAFRGEL